MALLAAQDEVMEIIEMTQEFRLIYIGIFIILMPVWVFLILFFKVFLQEIYKYIRRSKNKGNV